MPHKVLSRKCCFFQLQSCTKHFNFQKVRAWRTSRSPNAVQHRGAEKLSSWARRVSQHIHCNVSSTSHHQMFQQTPEWMTLRWLWDAPCLLEEIKHVLTTYELEPDRYRHCAITAENHKLQWDILPCNAVLTKTAAGIGRIHWCQGLKS